MMNIETKFERTDKDFRNQNKWIKLDRWEVCVQYEYTLL